MLSWHSPFGVAPESKQLKNSRSEPTIPSATGKTSPAIGEKLEKNPPRSATTSPRGAWFPSHKAVPFGPTARQEDSQDVWQPSAHQDPR